MIGLSRMAGRAALVLLAAWCTLADADQHGDWLNVIDCGASGSRFTTAAATTAGSAQITVKDTGDFRAGQGVMLSRCHPHVTHDRLWGPKTTYGAKSGRSLKGLIDIRGLDEMASGWTVYVIDVEPISPPRFRWSDDMGRTWKATAPITYQWQPLRGGLEIRFQPFEWTEGYSASFSLSDQLLSTVAKIEGKRITLAEAPSKSVGDAILRHRDDAALQAAVDRAIKEKRNVYFPAGHYCLARGMVVRNPAGITLEGADGEQTVLDLSEGQGCCVSIRGGAEATVRNFKMLGNMGFAERDQAGHFRTLGSRGIWGQDLKTSFATGVVGTERVTIENVHAYRMSLEAFWSGGPSRSGTTEPKQYTKAINYVRCWAIDCARNGFNNNDLAENTSILYCRIVDVGGCAWEGASRFVKITGNYVRNAGTVAIGNISSRKEAMEVLGSAQHIVTDNVFESVVPYGGCAIRSGWGATQVVIANNLFVNFGSSAVEVSGVGDDRHLPSANTTITGNIFDMTEIGTQSRPRTCIDIVGAADTIIADNQMYVRGACDPQVTAIHLREPAINVLVHDNLIRHCGTGLAATSGRSRVAEVIDLRTFVSGPGRVPMERRRSHRYRGYSLVWIRGGKPQGPVTVEEFDPETLRYKLAQPANLKPGDWFEVSPPAANWSVHDNTITGCLNPVVLDAWGSATSIFRGNTLERGAARGVKQVLSLRGWFEVRRNTFFGFDEPDSCTLFLLPNRLGQSRCAVYENLFENCASVTAKGQEELWRSCRVEGNLPASWEKALKASGSAKQ